ncbi:hypothetical protein HZ326_31616 [Fusarium oxysporum f. sp. albedinis]|nr:hypothetical protein HZ326_31616 [Fusarium oxysporum f. sp. albedinis]
MTMTWRWIPSSRPVSVVSDLLPLRRQAHEEISASNSPLSSMSLWPGLIGLMWKLRILWSGGCPAMSAECERVFSQTKKSAISALCSPWHLIPGSFLNWQGNVQSSRGKSTRD